MTIDVGSNLFTLGAAFLALKYLLPYIVGFIFATLIAYLIYKASIGEYEYSNKQLIYATIIIAVILALIGIAK